MWNTRRMFALTRSFFESFPRLTRKLTWSADANPNAVANSSSVTGLSSWVVISLRCALICRPSLNCLERRNSSFAVRSSWLTRSCWKEVGGCLLEMMHYFIRWRFQSHAIFLSLTFPKVETPSPVPTSIFLVAERDVKVSGPVKDGFWYIDPLLEACLLDDGAIDWWKPKQTLTVNVW